MKKALITIGTLIFILSFCFIITGCSKADKSDMAVNSTSSNNTQDNSTPDSSEESLSIEAYKSVLQDKNDFYSTDDAKNTYLKDLLSNGAAGIKAKLVLTHFAVLDMDGDKVSEVVLDLSFPGSEGPDLYEVLHYMDGTVYGYCIPYRGLTELKSDGTFTYSNGAADWGYATLKFTADNYDYNKVGYSEAGDNGAVFYIDNHSSTKEAFDTFSKKQVGKAAAEWFEFSQEKVDTQFSIN